MAFPMLAQYTGPGFYRVQNKGNAGRYIAIANDRVSEETKHISTGSAFNQKLDIEALATVLSAESNPATILYISGNADNGLVLESQGQNSQTLINSSGKDIKLKYRQEEKCLWSSYDGTALFLADDQWDEENGKYYDNCAKIITNNAKTSANDWGKYPEYVRWEFKKVDNVNEYLGVYSSEGVNVGDKYYTTLYTSFAYQLSDDMKAYYIDQHIYDTNHVQEPIAELKEVTGGKVPSGTPVILELNSNKASDNKVMPVNESLAQIQGNELVGRYFCYIVFKGHGKQEGDNQTATDLKNALEFNKNTMRVLGVKDGKLAMVAENNSALIRTTKASTGSGKYYYYIPANKAYLPIKSSESAATSIKLLLPDEYAVATSINKVTSEEKPAQEGIYTLTGVKVKDGNNTNDLPRGIYIVNGKKQIIK